MKRYVNAYNKLVPLMNKLSQEGYDIWEYHDNWCGFGFKAIFENSFVNVSINVCDETASYYLEHQEKTGNILLGKTINSTEVLDVDAVECFIKEFCKG